jgi:hypothetical protein
LNHLADISLLGVFDPAAVLEFTQVIAAFKRHLLFSAFLTVNIKKARSLHVQRSLFFRVHKEVHGKSNGLARRILNEI